MKKYTRGFTLIELLVVIAIIGILSSVVLVSLNSARQKGSDAKIQSTLSGLRGSMEVYYSSTNSYGASTDSCSAGAFADTTASNGNPAAYIASLTSPTCHAIASPAAYAISAQSISNTANWFCVDSSGIATTTVANSITTSGDITCN